MKKNLLLPALLLTLSNLSFSQFKLVEGPTFETPKDYKYKGIYAVNDNNFYTYRIIERKVKPQVRIEAYDKKTLSQVNAKDNVNRWRTGLCEANHTNIEK